MHSFMTNCTIPPEGTNFVGAAPIRGTLQILWSSLSVLILCTWSVVHLNVPSQDQARTKTQKLRRMLNRFSTKVAWMMFNVIAPEWIITKALLDWLSVRHLSSKYEAQKAKDGVPWSDTHTHFANQGGFGISFRHLAQTDPNHESMSVSTARPGPEDSLISSHLNNIDWATWTRQLDNAMNETDASEAFRYSEKILSEWNATSQGWRIDNKLSKMIVDLPADKLQLATHRESLYMNLVLLRVDLWILDAAQLLEARKLGIIDALPNISEDDLSDRDNSNLFVKALAAGQTLWFGLQFLVRFSGGQTNTQLEVMVFAFVICSVAAYALSWSRLKDPEHTIVSNATRYPNTGMDVFGIATKGPFHLSRRLCHTIWHSNSQIPAFRTKFCSSETMGIMIAPTIASFFGALHCIAWNFTFPSRVDQIIWRVSSLITALIFLSEFPIGVLTMLLWIVLEKLLDDERAYRIVEKTMVPTIFIPLVVFLAARLCILVEVFRSLGFQPPEAFQTTWINNIPHIG